MYKILKPNYQGKVRDIFNLDDSLVMVSSDRISAFDVVFKETIPEKGKILNRMSINWFGFFPEIPNHIIETDHKKFPAPFNQEEYLEGRSILVKKCKRIDYECVVRGYISGSAFQEYKTTGKVAGISYPEGMLESSQFAEPIFTPARKNDQGHDENISEAQLLDEVGESVYSELKSKSLFLYKKAHDHLENYGIILADTKFEFGVWENEIILIDELLTPDSSRYWSKDSYVLGKTPPSMDKQILRNYLLTLDWDKSPPPPQLPQSIQIEIKEKYLELEKKVNQCILQK
ncbi:MAG: phosphoribosylaminoimidazolesuccinocarboxamide synthase [Leptospira sp.]|nr:phosphoribosylaminoimidazolesuccinocarboxamide synthase [Leptospira sp.]